VLKLRILGSFGGSVKGNYVSCFLINDAIALDAGSLTQTLRLEEQLRVRDVIISHAHLDHNGALPFFAINVYGRVEEPVVVHGTSPVLRSLRQHMFNDVLWPDFSRLPNHDQPTLKFREIENGKPFSVNGIRFTAIPVNHITPTSGFLVEDRTSAILYTSDTGPTERVWEVARRARNLRAIITEASFPNEEHELARASGHMTPAMLGEELLKVDRRVRILVTHVKPGHRSRISRQLKRLGRARLELLQQGKTYRF
jgi:ribonuclease BN (tRNA processing enzyme)